MRAERATATGNAPSPHTTKFPRSSDIRMRRKSYVRNAKLQMQNANSRLCRPHLPRWVYGAASARQWRKEETAHNEKMSTTSEVPIADFPALHLEHQLALQSCTASREALVTLSVST